MGHETVEIVQAIFTFLQWFAGGIGAAIGGGIVAIWQLILVPCRTAYLESKVQQTAILARIADGIDSARKNIKEIKEAPPPKCSYPADAPTAILPPKKAVPRLT